MYNMASKIEKHHLASKSTWRKRFANLHCLTYMLSTRISQPNSTFPSNVTSMFATKFWNEKCHETLMPRISKCLTHPPEKCSLLSISKDWGCFCFAHFRWVVSSEVHNCQGWKNPNFLMFGTMFLVLMQRTPFLPHKHHHWWTLSLFPCNLNLSAIKPNKIGFCWTSYDWVFRKNYEKAQL